MKKRILSFILVVCMTFSFIPTHVLAAENSASSGSNVSAASAEQPEVVLIASDNFESGDGSEKSPYIIKTAQQLSYLSSSSMKGETYEGKFISFAADIDMNGYSWVPLYDFRGTIYGNNFTVSNLVIENSSSVPVVEGYYCVGFAGLLRGRIYDLNFSNINVNITYGNVYCGGIAGYVKSGLISNCDVSGSVKCITSVTGNVLVGGVAGYLPDSVSITKVNVSAAVRGESTGSGNVFVGGLAGEIYGTISLSSSTGPVVAKGKTGCAGGLVATLYAGKIINSYSTSSVTSTSTGGVSKAGGLAGRAVYNSNVIQQSYYIGSTVKADATAENYNSISGGIVGSAYGCSIDACFAGGSIIATTKYNDASKDHCSGKGYASHIIGNYNGSYTRSVTDTYYSSSMSLSRTTTTATKWTEGSGCSAEEVNGYKHGTATTESIEHGTSTAEANFKSNNFITEKLGWTLFSNIASVTTYNNAWIINGDYPKLYTGYVYSATVVKYVGDKVLGVDYRLCESGYVFNYSAPDITGHTADKANISATINSNQVYTVKYVPNKHLVTINYLSARDTSKVLLPQYSEWYSYGEYFDSAVNTDLVPEMIGYTVLTETSRISGYMNDADIHYTVFYDPNPCTVTVNYRKKDGTEVAPSVTYNCFYDDEYSIPSPVVEGYTAGQSVVSGVAKGDKVINLTYSVNPYTITVEHVYENGNVAAVPDVYNCEYGETYMYFPKEIEGYTADNDMFIGTVGAQNITLRFTYKLNYYDLTIRYINANGEMMADTYKATLPHGESYMIDSPGIAGYQISPSIVSGVITSDTHVIVNYNLNPHNLKINYYDGDTLVAVYEQEYDYTADYEVNTFANVPAKYSLYYDFVGEDMTVVSGTMPDADVEIDVRFVRSVVGSGSCGDGITWTLYKDGELTLVSTGDGVMDDFTLGGSPWYSNREVINKVTVEGKLSSIGKYAFADCININSVDWLEGVTKISAFAFSGCSGVIEIHIPSTVVEIAGGAFANMENLVAIIVDADHTEFTVKESLLYNKACTKLLAYPGGLDQESVEIAATVTEIGAYAFYGIDYISEIKLNNGLTKIGEYAFYGCTVETLVFEGSISHIGTQAFDCTTLKAVYFKGDVPSSVGQAIFGKTEGSGVYVYYPAENTTWKSQITTEIADQFKYYYWKGYKAYETPNISDVTVENASNINIYAIKVLFKNDATSIADVAVTFNGYTKTTDSDGFVYFTFTEELTWTYLTLSKAGYNSNYNTAYRYVLKPIGIDYLELTDDSAVHGVTCNGNNIINGNAYINTLYDGDAKIIVQGSSTLEIAEMLIVQNGIILASSDEIRDGGRCTIEVKNGAFQKDAGDVYVYMIVKDGEQLRHAATEKLNLILIAYDMREAELLSSFTSAIGDTFNGLTVPIKGTGIPFLDGSKITLTPPDFEGAAGVLQKVSVDCDNNQVFVTYNLDGYSKECEEGTKAMQLEGFKGHILDTMGQEWYDEYCKENKYVDEDGNVDHEAALRNIVSQDDAGKLLTLDDFEVSSERKQKNFMSKLVSKTNEFLEKDKNIKKVDTQGKFAFDVELAGGFVITFDEDGHDIDPILQISIQLKSSISSQFVIAVINVPVVIEVSAKAEGTVTFTQFHLDLAKQKIELPDYVKIDVSGAITVSVGVGTRSISLGVFGRIGLETSIQIGGGCVYFDGLYFTGSVGLYAQAKILGFSVRWEKSWELFEWCAIQPRSANYANVMMSGAYDLSAYKVGASIQSIEDVKWTSDNTLDVVTDSYAYSNAKIAYVGEDLVMVYLDIADDRNDYNASTLMYTVYDFENDKWGTSQEVDGNKQSESDFELLVVDNDLYIVYTESNRLFGDDEFPSDDSTKAMIETSKAQDISVIRYDSVNGIFTDYRVLTNDSYQDSTPLIGMTGGNVAVAWVKNTGSDETAVFGSNYNNDIYVSYYSNGQWGAPECVQYGCGMIVDMAIGDIDTSAVAFVVDLDCDIYTVEDRSLYICDLSDNSIKFFEKYDTHVTNLQFVNMDGQKMLTWFEDHNIAYTVDGETVAYMFENPIETLDSAYKFIEVAEGYYAVVWAVPDEIISKMYAVFYTADGGWGDVEKLFQTSYYQMYMDVTSVHGDLKFAVSSTQMNYKSQEMQMYSKLCYMSLTTGYGMEIGEVNMSADRTAGLMYLDATLTNTSIKEIQNVAIYIKEYKTIEKKNQYHVGGVYPVGLSAGETDSFHFSCDYIEGLDFANCSLVITVYEGTLEELEKDIAELNKKEAESGNVIVSGSTVSSSLAGRPGNGGYVGGDIYIDGIGGNVSGNPNDTTVTDTRYDLKVEGEYIIIGSSEYLSVKVTNKGSEANEATLRIVQADTNEMVYEAYISSICENGTQYYLVKLDKAYFEETNARFICTVELANDENILDNQCEIEAYKVENADIVPYDELATAVEMSTHNAVLDKKDPQDVIVDIKLNGNEFVGISNVKSGCYWTTPAGEDTIRATISGDHLKDWEDGDYQIEFLFKTERSWINSILNLTVTDTTPIGLEGSVNIVGTLARGNKLSVDVSKLEDFYSVFYSWYVNDVLVSTDPTYTSTEADLNGKLRVEVESTGLIKGSLTEEYTITEIDEYSVDISSIRSSLQYKWYVDGNVVSEESTYTVRNEDVGKSIYVEVLGNGDYDGTIESVTHVVPKVARSVGTPIITTLTSNEKVVIGNMFLFGDGELYYGYSSTDDHNTVDNWQKERTFILPEDGYYYFFIKATEGDVYASAYSDSADYAYNVSKVVWIIDGKVAEELYSNGENPVYKESVIKLNTSDYYYRFDGWDVNGDLAADYSPEAVLPAVNSETVSYTAVFTEIPVVLTEALNVKGSTLYIQSDISINYYVSGEELSRYDSFYVEFIKNYYNSNGKISKKLNKVTEYTVKDGDYVFTYDGIAAKEMNDDIRTVVYAEKDGVVYCSQTDLYSVAKYAYNRIAFSENENMIDLAVSLLNYGSAAQDYFEYNEKNYANVNLTDAQKAMADKDVVLESVKDYITPENSLVLFTGSSLALEHKVAINYYFNMDSYVNYGYSTDDLVLAVKYGDSVEVFKADDFGISDEGYYVSFDGLAAKDMKTVCEATFYMNYGTDSQCEIGETMIYSIESYAHSQMNSSDEALVKMVKAMMHYGEAAYNYAAHD